MIPHRIAIEGFLSYRDRQVIDLDGLGLCMLSGPNGSGKSAVFDAITFALFNTHRGGATGSKELVNKRSTTAAVEFEFDCGGHRWRASRSLTLRNGKPRPPRQQARRWSTDGGGWDVVPDTESSAGFDRWVTDFVGLTAETFATSMLLRQGQADRLLTAKPAERTDLLQSVIGLKQYVDLHDRAAARKRSADADVRALEARVRNAPQVTPADVDAAAATLAQATALAAAADAAVDRLSPLPALADAWAAGSGKLAAATAERQSLDAVLARATQVATDHARLLAVRTALPVVRAIADLTGKSTAAEQVVSRLSADVAAHDADLHRRSADLQAARLGVANLDPNADADRERTATDHLAELATQLAAAQTAAGHRRELAKLHADRDRLPAESAADAHRAAVDHHRQHVAAIPWLTTLAEHRAAAVADPPDPAAAEHLNRATTAVTTTAAAESAADEHRRQSQVACATANADLTHARQWSADLTRTDGQADCPTCGQPLTAAHRSAERDRRAAHLQSATAAHAAAVAALATAESDHAQLRRQGVDARRDREAAADRHRSAEHRTASLVAHAQAAERAIANLPLALQDQASADPHWPSTTAAAELAATARVALAAAEQQAAAATKLSAERDRLSARIDAIRQAITIDADPVPVRAEYDRVRAERDGLRSARDARVADHKRATAAAAELQTAVERVTAAAHAARLSLSQEQARLDHHRQAIADARTRLPPGWQDGPSADQMAGEADALARSDVAADHARLSDAVATAARLDDRLMTLQSDLDRIPTDARRPAAAVAADLAAARDGRAARRDAHQRAAADHAERARHLAARRQLDLDYQQATATAHHWAVLAEHLDRHHLQLHLMRRAERQIVGFANTILDRLSHGGLMLQLTPDADADAVLDLVCINRHTAGGDGPIGVAFLSGSQQFRVAVALALAVGQYAGGGHRLGDCVIIDEGFGSLDAEGQAVMIRELHGLTALMRRVILVSHQDSFADAFPHGYRFALDGNGATRVTPLDG